MCCFPIGFSDITAIKVMRDGDGDGKCQEENGKWVPCPPGVATGTRLRNGKPLGQTIGQLAASVTTQGPSPKELEVINSGGTIAEWNKVQKRIQPPNPNDYPKRSDYNKALEKYLADVQAEYRRLVDEIPKRRHDKLKEQAPDLFDKDGAIRPEILEQYLSERRSKAAAKAAEAVAAQTQIKDEQIQAARAIEAKYATNGYLTENDQFRRMVGTAFGHTFTDQQGNKYRIDFDAIDVTDSGGFMIDGSIKAIDDDGREKHAGYFTRIISLEDQFAYHDLLTISDDYRSKGIATIFNAMNERVYKELGLTTIKTRGVSGPPDPNGKGGMSGATHWPAVGFNWEDADEKRDFLDFIQVAITRDAFRDNKEKLIVQELLNAARQQDFNDPDAITAGDLVRWAGAKEHFQQYGAGYNYRREI